MVDASGRSYERLVGRYALYGEIASGGMATVHFGRLLGPVGFSRTVAIKRLHAQFAKDPEFSAMFLDEARLAGRIQHPNVVSTLDVVALEGELFLVMEYVQGESLSKLLGTVHRRGGQIPPKVVSAIMSGVLHGLHAAHEATDERGQPLHIVHRDVSPQNVLVGTDGTARVLDFGVAKAVGRIQSTREGEIKGKLAYMAPEQMKGAAMDRRTDIYGAAVVLWETLTARRLFDGEHAGVVFTRVMSGDVAPPSRVMPGIPAVLDEIVARGLALDPNQRYPTARAFAMDLEDRVGIASPRHVGDWLAEVAGEALSKRAVRVKEIESISTPAPALLSSLAPGAVPPSMSAIPSPRSPNPSFADSVPRSLPPISVGPVPPSAPDPSFGAPPPIADPSTASGASSRLQASSITVGPVSPSSQGARNRWIPLAAALVAVVVGSAVAVGVFRGGEPSPAASEAANDSPAPALAPAPTPRDPSPAASPEILPTAAPEPTSLASAEPSASATARPQVPSKPAGKAPQGGDCNPPYTIDAKGIRRLKPQCL